MGTPKARIIAVALILFCLISGLSAWHYSTSRYLFVVDRSGKPVAGAQVSFLYGNHSLEKATTDVHGRARGSWKSSDWVSVEITIEGIVLFDAVVNVPDWWKRDFRVVVAP
jgi:hypothetical protein